MGGTLIEASVALTIAIWGFNYVMLKFGVAQIPPATFTWIRFSLVFLILVPIMIKRPPYPSGRNLLRLIGAGLLGVTFYQLFFTFAVHDTTSASASLLLSISPLFTALFITVARTDRLPALNWVGMGLAVLGVLVVLSQHQPQNMAGSPLRGDLFGVAAALCWAGYSSLVRPLVATYGPIRLTGYTAAVGAISLIPLGLPGLHQVPWTQLPASAYVSLAYSVVPVTLIGLVLWQRGLSLLGTHRTMVYLFGLPVIAGGFGALVIQEVPSWLSTGAGVLLLLGLYLARMPRRSPQPGAARPASGR